ncbi:MAG: ComEA family DNA-binding protein [Nevskiales bacterium]
MRPWLALILLCLPFGLAVAAVDLNTADQAALESLDGIGPVKARAIIEYREVHGPFVSPEQVLEVKGIGPKTLERIRSHIVIKPSGRTLPVKRDHQRVPAEHTTP